MGPPRFIRFGSLLPRGAAARGKHGFGFGGNAAEVVSLYSFLLHGAEDVSAP